MPRDADEKGLTVKKTEDMPEWYSQLCIKAELADYSPVRGCMVIRPHGYAIWERIQQFFDTRIKALGVQNAYFPMFIPESFFKREAEHAEGFAPEVAWVERHADEERLALRPTSETIMYDSYSRWIRSWRDLPLRINQWNNVVRWEVKDVKPFLRSREFLWQEGHCVYETEEQRNKETLLYLDEYRRVFEELLAVPVIKGEKTMAERFAGADRSYTIEAFMPDGKALQCGTSHDLSQGFARAFDIRFLGRDEKKHAPWQNSWGISTRAIGAMVMLHGDDKGLVLPPLAAPVQVVIVPILFEDTKAEVLRGSAALRDAFRDVRVRLDDRDEYSPGWKYHDWELKGVPLRVELGPRDLEKKSCVIARRDTGKKESVTLADAPKRVASLLAEMQRDMLAAARARMEKSMLPVSEEKAFQAAMASGKMALAPFCGKKTCEEALRERFAGVTARCIPLDGKAPKGKCLFCGEKALHETYFSRAY